VGSSSLRLYPTYSASYLSALLPKAYNPHNAIRNSEAMAGDAYPASAGRTGEMKKGMVYSTKPQELARESGQRVGAAGIRRPEAKPKGSGFED
jgi:hypothetical protein